MFLRIQSGVFTTIRTTEDLTNVSLKNVYVGQSIDNFSAVEQTHSVVGVCKLFGCHIKFVVSKDSTQDVMIVSLENNSEVRNEVDHQKGLPKMIREKTRKDSLYNEILKFLSTMNVAWTDPEVYGKPFVDMLCRMLWYIDGHHEVLASRSCPIPSLFSQFCGYNTPECSKHRKRSISNLSRDKLDEFCSELQDYMMTSWMQQKECELLKENLLKLVESLASYSSYLSMKNKSMKLHHSSPEPATTFEDSSHLKYITPVPSVPVLLANVDRTMKETAFYNKIYLRDFCPEEKRHRYIFIQELLKGLSVPIYLLTYSHRSNVGIYHFIWKVPDQCNQEACDNENLRIVGEIKKEFPKYHTRAMKQQFCDLYGRISPDSKPYILRNIYNTLVGDWSASRTTSESEVDARVQEALSLEDMDIVIDLREFNFNDKDTFCIFWSKCNEFLQSCTSVHERRHGTHTYMAKAVSIKDLIEKVRDMCPEDTPIPSNAWVQFNFFPRNPHSATAKRYRSRLQVKHIVQRRQLRKFHPDAHFCAALFRYEREYAIRFRDISLFVCIDDKHKISVGEPNYPVAAVERGKEVIVSLNETFLVADHDFSKFSLTPSVAMIVNIPQAINESWYTGDVYIGIKDSVFQPSSAIRHAKELHNEYSCFKDGGTSHFIYVL